MIILLVSSQVGLAYGTHFCAGKEVKSKVILGHEHLECGMEFSPGSCDSPDQTHFSKSSCCDNELISPQIEDDMQQVKAAVDVNPVFIQAFVHAFVVQLHADEVTTRFIDYSPPWISHDFHSLNQVFLI
jgi:hypothetical protein